MNVQRRALAALCATLPLLAAARVRADEAGSAAAAKAMLERAVAAVQADKPRALAAFNGGTDGFKENDLYVFCARTDGRVDAHIDPAQLGRNIKDQYDVHGVAFGQEMMAIAEPGTIKGVSYMWPKPGTNVPAQKVSYVTRVADQVCGVGFYQ
jgi:signal transduction histidine kinase